MLHSVSNYFDLGSLDYVSNSDLSKTRQIIMGGYVPKNLIQAYKMGTLTDALITQKDTVNEEFSYIENESDPGTITTYEDAEMQLGIKLRDVYNADKSVKELFADAKHQHIVIREKFHVEHNGETVIVKARCKFDLYQRMFIGGDIKTTAALSEKAFSNVIETLDYDRQAAWYMDLARLDRFMIIGLGKKVNRQGVHPVYKFAIKRGSDTYKRGKEKYQNLVFLHKMLND